MDALGRAVGHDAYFSRLIRTSLEFSEDSISVLSKLNDLWSKSLADREDYYAKRPVTEKEPDLHLLAWDAGVYQLKPMWRELYPADWKELQEEHKALAARLAEGVYTFGFLRR